MRMLSRYGPARRAGRAGRLGGLGLLGVLGGWALVACGTAPPIEPDPRPRAAAPARPPDVSAPPPSLAPDYLDFVAYRPALEEPMLLHWSSDAMPLRVHLPMPPADLVSDPRAAREAVRLGVLGWTDVVGPGLPSIVFVEHADLADVPIVWAREPRGWFVASCRYRIDPLRRHLDVSELMVTGRWRGGEETPLPQLEAATLHEMGHALGLTGHSPHPRDVMYKYVTHETKARLSARDRTTLKALYALPNGTRLPDASAVVY